MNAGGKFSDLLEDGPEPVPEEEPQPTPQPSAAERSRHPDCTWMPDKYPGTTGWSHGGKCRGDGVDPPKPRPAGAPKSLRIGRIYDRESSRREAKALFETALADNRLTPCARYVYGQLSARWFRAGSVYVMAPATELARFSNGEFSDDQCARALDFLELLGYIKPVSWKHIAKKDRGLYNYAKERYAGKGGRWGQAYHMKQDLPEEDVIPDEENPILQMMGLVPA